MNPLPKSIANPISGNDSEIDSLRPISSDVADLLTNIAQLMDGWRVDESWSEWDEIQRKRITDLLKAYRENIDSASIHP